MWSLLRPGDAMVAKTPLVGLGTSSGRSLLLVTQTLSSVLWGVGPGGLHSFVCQCPLGVRTGSGWGGLWTPSKLTWCLPHSAGLQVGRGGAGASGVFARICWDYENTEGLNFGLCFSFFFFLNTPPSCGFVSGRSCGE